MGRSTTGSFALSDKRKDRKFTPKQKVELVLASFRDDRSMAEICREHLREAAQAVARPDGRGRSEPFPGWTGAVGAGRAAAAEMTSQSTKSKRPEPSPR